MATFNLVNWPRRKSLCQISLPASHRRKIIHTLTLLDPPLIVKKQTFFKMIFLYILRLSHERHSVPKRTFLVQNLILTFFDYFGQFDLFWVVLIIFGDFDHSWPTWPFKVVLIILGYFDLFRSFWSFLVILVNLVIFGYFWSFCFWIYNWIILAQKFKKVFGQIPDFKHILWEITIPKINGFEVSGLGSGLIFRPFFTRKKRPRHDFSTFLREMAWSSCGVTLK